MRSQGLQTGLVPILLIYGPTASGKSALAVDLAHHFGGEIINTDSMQVYQGLPILTAQPDSVEQDGVMHHLYGYRDPAQPGSVGVWVKAALDAIHVVQEKRKVPILVGGTGLYFEALTRGLAKIPPIGSKAIAAAETLLKKQGISALRAAVTKVDPVAAARILGADQQRLLRAYSVYVHTGQSLSAFQKDTSPALAQGSWRAMVLRPKREVLYQRIAARFDSMIAKGALDEAQGMAKRHLPDMLPAMKALGLKSLIGHTKGQITLEDATTQAVRDTRRYAKRQYTWASGRFSSWPSIESQPLAQQKEDAMSIIERSYAAPDAGPNTESAL